MMLKPEIKFKSRYNALNKSRLYQHKFDNKCYQTGCIATQFGFVKVYRQDDYYDLAFIWNGIEYTHTKQESISEQALTRRATQFAKSVVGEVMMGKGVQQ